MCDLNAVEDMSEVGVQVRVRVRMRWGFGYEVGVRASVRMDHGAHGRIWRRGCALYG